MPLLIGIDQSTSATKVLLIDPAAGVIDQAVREHRQHYPRAGWVEHDADEIWFNLLAAAKDLLGRHGARIDEIVGISITNQRETFVIFDRHTGAPLHRAIVWQCRRGDELCREHQERGTASACRRKTGLPVDSYFSAPKLQWLLRNDAGLANKLVTGTARFGTIDTYLVHRLTEGGVYATDYTNASRTLLFNIHRLEWDAELCDAWEVPLGALPEIRESAAHYGSTTLGGLLPRQLPITGVMGDSQASLFAQRCFEPGMAKVTFGSGSSVLVNVGHTPPTPKEGAATTLAWVIHGRPTYACEGIISSSASTIAWLQHQLQLIGDPRETEEAAREVPSTEGVYLVPAFSGLSMPYWAPNARAAIIGLTAHTDRRHVLRAAVESIAYQVRDVLDRIHTDTNVAFEFLNADGGATANAFLMQFCADVTRVELRRSQTKNLSALGAAWMGMLGLKIYRDLQDLGGVARHEDVFTAKMSGAEASRLMDGWHRAVQRVI